MCRLLESIKVENREFRQLFYHAERMRYAQRKLYGISSINLEKELDIPASLGMGKYKCRVVYDRQILKIDFVPYQIKSIRYLKLIESDISYELKYEDRSELDALYQMRGEADDILIIKDGLISDSSYANVCFWDGSNWMTPAKPLLAGTKRAFYMDKGLVQLKNIRPQDLSSFECVSLINAMIDLDELCIDCKHILY